MAPTLAFPRPLTRSARTRSPRPYPSRVSANGHLKGVDRLLFRVPSVPAAARFWKATWGMRSVREDEGLALLGFGNGGGEVLLHNDPDLPAQGVFLLVDDVRGLYERRDELHLTFTAKPTRAARGYRATVRDPFGTVLLILDRCAGDAPDGAAAEDVRVSDALFPGVPVEVRPRRADLVRAYVAVGRTADDLPYTPHFEKLHEQYAMSYTGPQPDYETTWRHLLNTRKAGQLPKLGEARSRPPEATAEERQRLREIVGDDDMRRRDRLPYTRRFDEIADAFNRAAGPDQRPLSPHQLWRLIAVLAK